MKIRKVINHGNVRYRVTANLDGTRKQRFFASKREARAWMTQVNRLDPLLGFWESLSERDKKQLSLIYETSTRLGIELGLTLRSLANLDLAQKSSKCLNEAADEYLAFKHTQNLRPSSLNLIKTSLSQMVIRLPKYQCDQITTKMLEDWFSDKKWKRSTVDGVIAKIGPFFSWAVQRRVEP